jgi:hypothetical protein
MNKDSFSYEEIIRDRFRIWLAFIIPVAIMFALLSGVYSSGRFTFTNEAYFYGILLAIYIVIVVFLRFTTNYRVKLSAQQLSIRCQNVEHDYEIREIKELEIMNTQDAKQIFKINYGIFVLFTRNFKEWPIGFYRPYLKKITERVLTFKRIKDNFRVIVSTNNPEQLFSLLIQSGAQKK